MAKTLDILIGDDVFTSPGAIKSALFLTLIEMWGCSGKEQKQSITLPQENGLYICKYTPFGEDSQIRVKAISNVEDMITEFKTPYDWIITDLNYGEGNENGGIEIVKALPQNLKDNSVLAVCTSENNPRLLKALRELNIDYVVSPKLMQYDGTKFELLGKVMAEHYCLNALKEN